MASRTLHTGMAVDTSELKNLAKYLRQSQRKANKDFRRGLRAAGELIAVEARARASEHSTTIPATIKTRVAGATVSVQAGSNTVPIAALFEEGNTGGKSGKKSGTFRHPVFGRNDDPWVSQPMHPYLVEAGAAKNREALELLGLTIDEALRSVQIEVI